MIKDGQGRREPMLTMAPLVKNALALAFKHHAGQKRKYDGVEYVQHVIRVAMKTARQIQKPDYMGRVFGSEIDIAAALLHDTKEDTSITDVEFVQMGAGGHLVLGLVKELTNPSKEHKEKPRKVRKQMDRDHLKHCSTSAKRIKLIDRIDNLMDLKDGPADFKLLYATESMDLYNEALKGTFPDLDAEYLEAVDLLMGTTIWGRDWRQDEYRHSEA